MRLADASDMLLGQHVFVEPDYGQSEKKKKVSGSMKVIL